MHRLSRLRQLNLTDCRSLEALPDGMESLDAVVWLEGCLALRRPLAMAAWSAEMYCRQLDTRFGTPPDHGSGEQRRQTGSGDRRRFADAVLPQVSEVTQQCLSVIH